MQQVWNLARLTYRQARRVVILVAGILVVLTGVAMLALPGPGLIVIPIGLAILAIEFAWARRWLQRLKRMAAGAKDFATNGVRQRECQTAAAGDRQDSGR